MHVQAFPLPLTTSSAPSAIAPRYAPPAHIRRWTGRVALTLPLPSLAALRIAAANATAGATTVARG